MWWHSSLYLSMLMHVLLKVWSGILNKENDIINLGIQNLFFLCECTWCIDNGIGMLYVFEWNFIL